MVRVWWAALFDVLCVLTFAALGIRAHEQDDRLLWVAIPFLAALAIGWVLAIPLRAPSSIRAGALIWLTTLAGGMILRRVGDDGTAAPFVLVAAVFLAATMLGWRLIAVAVSRRGRQPAT